LRGLRLIKKKKKLMLTVVFFVVAEDGSRPEPHLLSAQEREFFIDNLLVRIHFINVTIRWTGLAPWEFELPFPGSLTSTFLVIVSITVVGMDGW